MTTPSQVTRSMEQYLKPVMENTHANKQSYDSGHIVTNIPIKRYSDDPAEEKLAAARQVMDTAEPGFYEGLDIEKYLPYYIKRADEDEELRFEEFIMKTVDPSSAYEVDWLINNVPGIYEKYDQEIDRNAELLEHVCLLMLRGVRTTQDLYLVFAIATGKVKVDTDAIARLLEIDEDSLRVSQQARNDGYLNAYEARRLTTKPENLRTLNFAQPFKLETSQNGRKHIILNYRSPPTGEDENLYTIKRDASFAERFKNSISKMLNQTDESPST